LQLRWNHPPTRIIVNATDSSTILLLKKVAPVRLVKNKFAEQVLEAENRGATKEELIELLGKHRERKAIFDGDLQEGEIEAGQSSGLIKEILPAAGIVELLMNQYYEVKSKLF
jgi:enoyl-[acyl-carrier protein] reductase II